MSPELINNKNGKVGYDGRSVDVWASGILLLVMLLGSFPFDHIEHPDPNTSEAPLEVIEGWGVGVGWGVGARGSERGAACFVLSGVRVRGF